MPRRQTRDSTFRARWCWLALVASILLGSANAFAASHTAWNLKRSRDGIKVYTRQVPGSKYDAVKATMTVHTSLSALSALVRDTRECSKWQALCERAQAIKIISPEEMYVYQINKLPWPVSDRDVVALVKWHQNKKTLAVTMRAHAVTGVMPRQQGLVRVTRAETRWTFMPAGHGMVKVTTEAHINPGGPIPAWVVNWLIVSSPYKTLSNMRRILATGRFNDARLSFIREPHAR